MDRTSKNNNSNNKNITIMCKAVISPSNPHNATRSRSPNQKSADQCTQTMKEKNVGSQRQPGFQSVTRQSVH